MARRRGRDRPRSGSARPLKLVFAPGFACPPRAYDAFLASIRAAGVDATAGRFGGPDTRAGSEPVVLAGHSRGGLLAYRAAAAVQPAALVLVDPVSGDGPPWARTAPLPDPGWSGPALVLGCGIGGHCAPAGRNHAVFAAVLQGCRHLVVPDCGHADLLTGPFGVLARRLCAGGPDPDAARDALAACVTEFLRDLSPDPAAG